jgi:hypothetical protein
MKHAHVLAVLALLATSVGGAFETNYMFAERNQDEIPQSFITLEIFSIGPKTTFAGGWPTTFRLISLDARWWRIRGGISVGEFGYGYGGTTFLSMPVRVGLTLWQRPMNYVGCLWGMLPEVYLQASATPSEQAIWSIDPPPTTLFIGHAELRAAADMYGVGIDVGAGVGAHRTRIGSSGEYWTTHWYVGPVLDARVRLLVTNFGL